MAKFSMIADSLKAMQAKHTPFMPYWQQLTDVLLPNRADFTKSQSTGQSRESGIYDGTPRLAQRDLSSTLDGLIKPKTSNWFTPGHEDEEIRDDDEAKLWFDMVRERMWRAIYNKNARFIQRSGEVDQLLACIGWGALWMQENRSKSGLMFRTFPAAHVVYDENEEGTIDQMGVTEPAMSAHQLEGLYKRFALPPPKHVAEALSDPRSTKTFKTHQIVVPRDSYLGMTIQAPSNLPFVSAVVDVTGENVITEMGFAEFPAAIPRWDTVPGEIYPRSPGMMALPDSRTLQAMGKTLLVGGQRAVDPPMWVLNDAVLSPLRTYPGGITVLDAGEGQGQPIGAFPVSENIPLGREMQNDYRAKVEAAFFKNVFNLPVNGPNMTATEVVERKDEFIRIIGPVFGRLETDYAGHIVERVFGIMDRAGAFPPRPQILIGQKITFTFASPIQQARKQLEIAGFAKALEFLQTLIAVKPHIMDNFDEDEIARSAPDWSGMSTRWIRPKKDVAAIRQKTEQQQQGASLDQSLPNMTQGLKNVAQAGQANANAARINSSSGQGQVPYGLPTAA